MSDQRPELFDQAAYADEAEVLDGVAVIEDRPLEPPRAYGALSPVVVQTVAVVGASMVAGAATVAIVHRRRARRRRRRRLVGPVLGSRSFLIDVHVLGERERGR